MTDQFNKIITGAGGGGGDSGGTRAGVEDPDSLQSRTMVSLLDLIGEGQLGGLVNSLQSIYFNDTPVQNADGSMNFAGVTCEFRDGQQSQLPIAGFQDIESPHAIGVQVKQVASYTTTITNPNADQVRAIVYFPALYSQDMSTGDIHGTTVEYKFSISTDEGPFVDALADQAWQTSGAWTSVDSVFTATRASGSVGVGAGINMSGYGSVQILAEYFASGAWTQLGSVIKLSQSPIRWFGGSASQANAYVEAPNGAEKIRFTVLSQTPIAPYYDGDGIYVTPTAPTVSSGAVKSLFAVTTCTVSGKTRSKYQRAHLLTLPKPASTWRIRMTRITADSTVGSLSNDSYFDSTVEIVNSKLTYPNSALCGIKIDSSQFNSIPNRSYLVKGMYIRVPTNYDPVARTYSGVWDGTFKLAVSSCPPWVLYDVLTNARYGLGQYLSASQINKAKLYQIGRYCDEMVSDGFGGLEPRFAINTAIQTQAEAFKLISDLSSVFRGMSYWAGGMTDFVQDAPTDPSMIYSSANVIDGMFNYTGSARKDRHSVVLVTWNDPEQNFKQTVEYVEDADLISKFGIRKLEMVAFGCTSRGQANRVGKWVLYTEAYESDMVSFAVGIDSALVEPGEIIQIHDSNRAGKRMSGRLKSSTRTSATLDAPLTVSAGLTTLSVRMPDGSFVERPISQSPDTLDVVTWDDALPDDPLPNAIWLISEESLVPMLARVVGISQGTEPGTFNITALEHNPSKFAAIDEGLVLQEMPTSNIKLVPVAPSSVMATDSIYKNGSGIFTMITLSWPSEGQTAASSYAVKYRRESDNWTEIKDIRNNSIDILNVTDGVTYEFRVYAVNAIGITSGGYAETTHYTMGKQWPPADVESITATQQADRVILAWTPVDDLDLATYEVRCGDTWDSAIILGRARTVGMRLLPIGSGSYAGWDSASPTDGAESSMMKLLPMPAGTYTWLVKAIDTSGNYSLHAASTTFVVIAPTVPVVTASVADKDAVLSWGPSTSSFAVDKYEIRTGASWAAGTFVKYESGLSCRIPVDWSGLRTFWVAAIDIVGNVGGANSADVAITAPSAPMVTSQVIDNNVLLYWTDAKRTLPITTYQIRRGADFSTAAIVGDKNGLFTSLFEVVGGTYTYWVVGIDSAGNAGTPAATTAVINQPPDYVLKADYDSSMGGTLSNALFQGGTVLLPVNTTETFAGHFTARSWSTPQDQIAAGFEDFIEPAASSGYYEEVLDYGTVLAGSKVTASASTFSDGSPTVTMTISTKAALGDAWTDFANVSSVYAANFRYVKVRITATSSAGLDLLTITGLNIRIDVKLKTITRTLSCVSTDSGGTELFLTDDGTSTGIKLFIDVQTITPSVSGTDPVIAVYDFTDAPNPLSCKILLFNSTTGARVSGTSSVVIRGS